MKIFGKFIKLFYLPLITYVIFFAFRFFGEAPSSDLSGMHAVMGAAFITFGCSICYLMSILPNWDPYKSVPRLLSRFWLASTMLFYLLLGDASLAIHENLGHYLGGETVIFLVYGGLLLTIVGIYWRSLKRPFWLFFLSFIIFSGVAVLGDSTQGHEGVLNIAGQEFSYEQFCETFSMLLLSLGFATEAIQDIIAPFKTKRIALQHAAGYQS